MPINKSWVIAVANRKGGTGKTTTAVNLAAEWGAVGYKTLLIDLDTQGHTAIGVGYDFVDGKKQTVHDIFQGKGEQKLIEKIHKTKVENVYIAPANTDFMGQDINAVSLRNAIREDSAINTYQRIIIDTPPTLDSLLINALSAADGVVVPFVPHHLASVGVRQLAKLFYQVATRHNADLKLLGLLPVMYDRHVKLHKRVLEELAKQFGIKRILRGIRSNIKLAEAFEAGLPVRDYAPSCPGSMDYRLMAEELETFFK